MTIRVHTDSQLKELIFDLCQSMNMREPPTDRQVESLCAFVRNQFGNLTEDELRGAFGQAAAGRLGVDMSEFATYSIFFWGKVLGSYEKRTQEDKARGDYKGYERKGQSPDEFVSTGTRDKVHGLLSELASKKTNWLKQSELPNLNISPQTAYDMAADEFALAHHEKFGGRVKAREAFTKAIDRKRWDESQDMKWVEVEISKLVL